MARLCANDSGSHNRRLHISLKNVLVGMETGG
jgi:hypothetical protein